MNSTPSIATNKKVWIIGCGDIGRRVAALYSSRYKDIEIKAIVSSTGSVKRCEQQSIKAVALNLDNTYSLAGMNFEQADLFYFAPPTQTGTTDKRLQTFLKQLGSSFPRRIVLISTTGVYGDSGGEWIDENTPVNSQADRALRRLSAEQSLQSWAQKTGCETMILRVPGIYALDRLPLARLKKNLPVIHAAEAGWTNRIHADDLAQACKAAMDCEAANEIINVTDGHPSSMTDYFNQIADYAGLPQPPQISLQEAEQTLSDGMVSYMKESRRIKNEKMLCLLKIKLQYPELKSCLNG